jgi:hypothetical protein
MGTRIPLMQRRLPPQASEDRRKKVGILQASRRIDGRGVGKKKALSVQTGWSD